MKKKFGPAPSEPLDRFLAHVQPSRTGCWVWSASCTAKGYPRFRISSPTRRMVSAHRWAYEYFVGPLPDGFDPDHLCRFTRCVNPTHLEAVTKAVNVLRGDSPPARNARKNQCRRGHPLSGDNLLNTPGRRQCRECARQKNAKQYQKHRDARLAYAHEQYKRKKNA